MQKKFKILIWSIGIILFILIIGLCYFLVGSAPVEKNIVWGVDFSQMQAEALKLDWKGTYSAILDDLGAKNIKLHTQWDFVEGKRGNYYFDDIDWQLKQASSKGAKIIFVLGMKTGRWPECHDPVWARMLPEDQEKQGALEYIKQVVLRYKDNNAIINWQVENEPLFRFGECPDWYYKNNDFLKAEVALVRSLDPSRKIIVSDTGELSPWFTASRIGDKVGITMYRDAWVNVSDFDFHLNLPGFYANYPIPPVYYYRKVKLIKFLSEKDVIVVELQTEPWASKPFYDVPIPEQEKTMNINQFKNNVAYAKQTGLNTFYFWGVEWWYWMKEKQNQPQIWNEAKLIFQQ